MRGSWSVAALSVVLIACTGLGGLAHAAARVDVRSVSSDQIHAARGEKASIVLTTSGAASLKVTVCGPRRERVRTLSAASGSAGRPTVVTWDGKDDRGLVVPDEAYYFLVEARFASGEVIVNDPTTYSGGEFGDIVDGSLSRRSGTITYSLSRPSRVLLRAGVPGGALLKTVVDWQARPKGVQTEYWNGKDADGLVDLLDRKGKAVVISYMTLPDHTVVTYGNSAYTYREYVERHAKTRQTVPPSAFTNNRKVSPHFTKDRLTDRGFKLKITFPELDKAGAPAIPTVRDRLLVNIEVDPKDLEVVANQQLEVILFMDLQFHSEEERGYLPFRYPLDLADLPAGEHVLTVNVVTFGDQVGIGSRKFRVVK